MSGYRNQTFQIMKEGYGFCLPVPRFSDTYLRPVVTNATRINEQDVERLTIWRNRHVIRFLTEFEATNQQTQNWLINRVGPDVGKILLMVDHKGQTVGHTGLGFGDWDKNYIEADAIVRGEDAPKGLMKAALQGTLRWARDYLGLDDQWVRVRSDNPAVEFYRAVGFDERKRVPLASKFEGEMKVWFEDPNVDEDAPALVYMKLDSNRAFAEQER